MTSTVQFRITVEKLDQGEQHPSCLGLATKTFEAGQREVRYR